MMSLIALFIGFLSLNTGYAYPNHRNASCQRADSSIIQHTGTPIGVVQAHNGIDLYISKPRGNKFNVAVLYLTDVFGIQLNENRLLADSFARAGFLTIAPDLFNGQPAPEDLNTPGFNTTEFLAQHGPEATDPLVAKAITYMRDTLNVERIAVTGYCFGGKYVFRFIAAGKGADAGFAAHPSLLENSEITSIDGPVSVAAAEMDTLLTPAKRREMEDLLMQTGNTYQTSLYSGTSHGFGVRANISDPRQKFAKEEAFWQAVKWFDAWA
ncbi:dienelactone hydrolase [Patellaria atrata CBS 101060]|uniref:Dienelactone hydrolase n=1 Tax=Patellaria atrata CBS 101060 TaxID=1346257 RepID=A0A9P4VNN6_9PEZI|nr:dienelactone hydrolase [Patellaria atrata CBS 101060]